MLDAGGRGGSVGSVTGNSRRAGRVIYNAGFGGDALRPGGVRGLPDFVFACGQPEEQAVGGSEQLARLGFGFAHLNSSQTYCSI